MVFASVQSPYFDPAIIRRVRSRGRSAPGHTTTGGLSLESEAGWRPIDQSIGAYLEMILDNNNFLAIGSLLYYGVSDGKRGWVTAYKLTYKKGDSPLFKPIINPETGGEDFNGITSETQNSSFSTFNPIVVDRMRIIPQAFFESMVLRWQLVFCRGNMLYFLSGCYVVSAIRARTFRSI